MNRHTIQRIFKIAAWTVAGVIGLILLVSVLLYVPWVQDFARRIAVSKVEESTGMKVDIGYLRLKFPLRLSAADVEIIQATGDTLLQAGSLDVNVKLMPLLKGKVDVDEAMVTSAFFGLGNRDSVMMLRARIDTIAISGVDVDLKNSSIAVTSGDVKRPDVYMRLLPDTTVAKPDTAASTPWLINAGKLDIADLTYRMEMLPTIDSLGCKLTAASLTDAVIDMGAHRIHGKSLAIDSVSAAYIYPAPSADASAVTPVDTVTVETASEPWTITADRLSLTGRRAVYALKDARPLPGLDMNYIDVSDITIEIDSFYNRGSAITVPLRRLSATERCGLGLIASGTFEMDSAAMRARAFSIETQRSSLKLDAEMGMGDLATDPDIPLMLKASGVVSPADAGAVMPAMTPLLSKMNLTTLNVDVDGTSGRLDVNRLQVDMPGVLTMKADGSVMNPMNFDKLGGRITLSGSTGRLTPRFSKAFALDTAIHIPAMRLRGNVDYNPGRISGNVTLATGSGRIGLKGRWIELAESYSADMKIDSFPVAAFMPSLGLNKVDATISASGRGLNFFSPKTTLDATVDMHYLEYRGNPLRDIHLDASLLDGNGKAHILSNNPGAEVDALLSANISGDTLHYDLDADLRNINLKQLNLVADRNEGSLVLTSKGMYGVNSGNIDARADVTNLVWSLPDIDITTPKIGMDLLSQDSLLEAKLNNGDLNLLLYSQASLNDFLSQISSASSVITEQISHKRFEVDTVSAALPTMDMLLTMGNNNVAAQFLKNNSDITFRNFTAGFHNDSLLRFSANVLKLATSSIKLDTVNIDASQHDRFLTYNLSVNNRPGTMDAFAKVNLTGFVASNRFSAFLRQQNIKNENGFVIGVNTVFDDSTVTARFVPYKPTISYKKWTINKDNFVTYDFADMRINANISLEYDNSYLHLFTDKQPGADSTAYDDVVLQLANIHLQDWLAINPFAPPVKGDVSADLRFNWNRSELTGNGMVGLTDLYYGRDRVGSFDLGVNLSNTAGGKVNADIALMVDSIKTITARGAINDSTAGSPFLLDFSMIKFPLRVLNPFLPKDMARLSGMLNGNMKITGDIANPVFNGYIDFDSTAVKVGMLGTTFDFSTVPIPVDSNIVKFNDFSIKAWNKNPLQVNGIVDVRHLSDIGIDLSLNANDMQIVNSSRPRGADVYGKAFVSLDATVKGNMSFLRVNADMSVLPGTNVTYIMPEATSAISSRSSGELVKFVQFDDTTQVVKADSLVNTGMMMSLTAMLRVMEGSVLAVDLATDGSNRVQLEPQGELDFTMSPLNGESLTGRLAVNGGYVRYLYLIHIRRCRRIA
ncbi:MAG: translocation/assembly module TamB domain-containing protein, partial [Duncaniella sp.]|nr:translocation/assembly module TamB domain-containing protein [Duncaniella sp.]